MTVERPVVGKRYIHVRATPDKFVGDKWIHTTDRRGVVLMAISGGYAMVRRPNCCPYVCSLKELEE